MAQSFWSEPDVEKFNQYVDWLKKVAHTFSSDKREKHVLKYRAACAKIQQLALSWGVDWKPKFPAAKMLAPVKNASKITWFNPKIEDVDRVGVWFGDNTKRDGFFVFNVYWLLSFVDGLPIEQRRRRLKIYIDFDCTPENYENRIAEYEENEDVLTREGYPEIDYLFPKE